MPKPNYSFEKRKRDMDKKSKKEEKRARKAEKAATPGEPGADGVVAPAEPESQPQS